jgi:hypothetical protein
MKHMKRMLLTVLSIVAVLSLVATASADILVNAPVQSVTTFLDKNGQTVARIVIAEKRALQGIDYEVGIPVMAFREHVEAVKNLNEGDTLKAICAKRAYLGKVSYVILKVVE